MLSSQFVFALHMQDRHCLLRGSGLITVVASGDDSDGSGLLLGGSDSGDDLLSGPGFRDAGRGGGSGG